MGEVVEGPLFSIPSEEGRQQIVSDFLQRTGNQATQMSVCYSCAREMFSSEMRTVVTCDLPHSELLKPKTEHPAQVLTGGLLLYRDHNMHKIPSTICTECLSQLQNNKCPELSLANNMWIGDVPFELKILSLPEVILVSHFLPAAYVVKLYLKKSKAKWIPADQLTKALRGNVASYFLKTEDVAPMVDEGYLPAHPSILAATIAVTFIGQRSISLKALKTLFTVEKQKVANALCWLIANNKLYQNIQISAKNLNALPEKHTAGNSKHCKMDRRRQFCSC